uniref:Factor of DNA methylation 1-5/IDN2 domain-containing protein n=1 Tax=Daucus carota subsp. sativus TaxID=79200 RepID=A0A161Y1D7_DAUCS
MEKDLVEELKQARRLVVSLAKEVDFKNQKLWELERKFNEASTALGRMVAEKDKLHESFAEEMRKMQFIEQKSEQLKYESECKIKKIQSNGVENEKLIQDLFYKQKELEQQKSELDKREAEFEVERKKFLAEKEKLKSQVPLEGDYNMTFQIEDLMSELAEKTEELNDMEVLNQTLIMKEHMSNDQLQEARKELLNVLPDLTDSSVVGVKRMGEVNQKPFQDACLQKFSIEEAEMRAMELSSLWQIKVNNSNWHPFKQVFKDEKLQVYMQMATCEHYEECCKARALVVQFAREIDYKNEKLFEMERRMDEREKEFQAYKEENERLKDKMELLKKEVEKLVKVLEETQYKSLLEQKKLLAKNEKLKYEFESQKKLCGRLDADLKEQGYDLMVQKSSLINREKLIFERECQLNKRIKMLQETEDRQVLKDTSIMRKEQKVEDPSCNRSDDTYAPGKDAEEKLRKELEYFESLNKTLMIKESMSNRELQDARNEVIEGLEGMLNPRSVFCIKRMGEVNRKVFQEICQQSCTAEDWEEQSATLCSLWERRVRDAHWHPFKRVTIDGKLQTSSRWN